MAAYDYRCRTCDAVFTVHRAMSDVATLPRCPQDHDDVARVWSAVAVTGAAPSPRPAPRAAGGACCGGGCCA